MPLICSFVALIAFESFAESHPWSLSGGTPLDVKTTPLESFVVGSDKENFGALKFLGGIAISSDEEFGAFSGLVVSEDGSSLLAVSDTGQWFHADIERTNGKLTALSNTQTSPIHGQDGSILNKGRKWNADAEGLTWFEGNALISFERQQGKLRIANLGREGFHAPARVLPESKMLNSIRGNRGIEAISVAPKGTALEGSLVAIGERVLNGGNHTGWVLKGNEFTRFFIRRRDDFDITAADFLPNGDLIILERRFSLTLGSAVRLRRLSAFDLKPDRLPGRVLDGIDLMTADLTHQIDNMEGMAVRTDANGMPIILLISDDNKNFFQRTLLLEFALRPEEFGVKPLPRPAAADLPRG
ncbi:MAG: esterase-like activity of phytase family protein [Hyphomicrobiales bacterium]